MASAAASTIRTSTPRHPLTLFMRLCETLQWAWCVAFASEVAMDRSEHDGREGPRVTVTDHHPVRDREGREKRVLHGVNDRTSSITQPVASFTLCHPSKCTSSNDRSSIHSFGLRLAV